MYFGIAIFVKEAAGLFGEPRPKALAGSPGIAYASSGFSLFQNA